MNLENIYSLESAGHRRINTVGSALWGPSGSQTHRHREKKGGRQRLGDGGGALAFHGNGVSVWEGEKVPETDGGDDCITF